MEEAEANKEEAEADKEEAEANKEEAEADKEDGHGKGSSALGDDDTSYVTQWSDNEYEE